MPTYSQGPRLLKGAIVAIDPATSGRSTIVFQYNPETVKRSLEPQMAGAPVETIDLEVTIDADAKRKSVNAPAIHANLNAI